MPLPAGRWLVLVLATALLPQSADPPSAAGPPGNETPAIQLTAVVTDVRGAPVAGLRAADFELAVDGRPQALEAAEARQDDGPRVFGFLLDEFHTNAADSTAIRAALLQFVERRVRAEDLAVVLKPLDSLTNISPARDREELRLAIASFQGRKGDYTPRTEFERDYMAQAPEAVASARGQIVTSALRALAASFGEQRSARTAIVLVSDGFERMRMNRELPANLQSAVRIANRAGAPVYAFAPSLAAPADVAKPEPAYAALRALTSATGGELVAGTGSIEAGLERMVRDLGRHYVLTYRPAHGADGRFHVLQLAVKRPGATVRSRSGYVAAAPLPVAASPRASSAPLRVLRRSPLIQSWAGIQPVPEGGRVTLTWEPSLPRPGAAAARSRAASVLITASASDGTVLFDAVVAPLTEPGSPSAPNHAEFGAPTGAVRVDMKILDEKGVVIDTDARDFVVPVRRKDAPTIYPPAVVRTRSARQFREAVEAQGIPPIATREFRRTDRLLIRVPVADAAGGPLPATAVLLNRLRQPMREVPPMEAAPGTPSLTLFDLPLSGLAPGEYTLRITATGSGGTASEYVTFRVTG